MSSKHILPATESKAFTFEAYDTYLNDFLKKDNVPKGLKLSFPSSLTSSNYTLTDGKVDRFYDPLSLLGSLDSIHFHQFLKEFYGVANVYGPKIDFSFKYSTAHAGSKQTGKLAMIVSHNPVQLQMDLGNKNGTTCQVDKKDNDMYYFYDKDLQVYPKFTPDAGSTEAVAKDLAKQLTETWVNKLYKIILKVKFEKLIADTKEKLLHDKKSIDSVKHICKVVM